MYLNVYHQRYMAVCIEKYAMKVSWIMLHSTNIDTFLVWWPQWWCLYVMLPSPYDRTGVTRSACSVKCCVIWQGYFKILEIIKKRLLFWKYILQGPPTSIPEGLYCWSVTNRLLSKRTIYPVHINILLSMLKKKKLPKHLSVQPPHPRACTTQIKLQSPEISLLLRMNHHFPLFNLVPPTK